MFNNAIPTALKDSDP
jgi:hypothetical protein